MYVVKIKYNVLKNAPKRIISTQKFQHFLHPRSIVAFSHSRVRGLRHSFVRPLPSYWTLPPQKNIHDNGPGKPQPAQK